MNNVNNQSDNGQLQFLDQSFAQSKIQTTSKVKLTSEVDFFILDLVQTSD